jgi:Fe-S-cluster containining protein
MRDAHAATSSDTSPWYAGGLHFECTRCGRCCTGASGYVWVTDEDIEALAEYLSMTLAAFGRRHLRQVGLRYALLERAATGDCVFLRDGLCTVYDRRPSQCRRFPWWREALASEEAWKETARECEGIDDAAPVVTREEIEAARER